MVPDGPVRGSYNKDGPRPTKGPYTRLRIAHSVFLDQL